MFSTRIFFKYYVWYYIFKLQTLMKFIFRYDVMDFLKINNLIIFLKYLKIHLLNVIKFPFLHSEVIQENHKDIKKNTFLHPFYICTQRFRLVSAKILANQMFYDCILSGNKGFSIKLFGCSQDENTIVKFVKGLLHNIIVCLAYKYSWTVKTV